MPKATSNKALIAKWTIDQDPCIDPPAKVYWEDGSPATINDYVVHSVGTHHLSIDENGCMKCEMYPDIVGDVFWDRFARTWVIGGNGVKPASLDLPSPTASDEEIILALSTAQVVYRPRIHRGQH